LRSVVRAIVRYAVGYECGDVGPASVLLNSFSGPARRSAALPQQKRGWTRHPPHQLIRGTGLHPLSPGTAATPARLGTHGASGVSANTTRRRIVLRAFREPRRRAPAPAGSVGLSTPPARHSCRRWRAHLAGAQFPGVTVLPSSWSPRRNGTACAVSPQPDKGSRVSPAVNGRGRSGIRFEGSGVRNSGHLTPVT